MIETQRAIARLAVSGSEVKSLSHYHDANGPSFSVHSAVEAHARARAIARAIPKGPPLVQNYSDPEEWEQNLCVDEGLGYPQPLLPRDPSLLLRWRGQQTSQLDWVISLYLLMTMELVILFCATS